jgi:UDP-2,3-diacylglucosamine pyrophosphatase LpxH
VKRKPSVVVISDVHLGTYGCHAVELLAYLKSIKPEVLILNGDIIDMWNFKKKYFPQEHLLVLQKIIKMALSGTKVFYITGNHDDKLRDLTEFAFGNISLRNSLHIQIKDKRYLFFHGDVFDASVNVTKFFAKLGGKGYDYLVLFNRSLNNWRSKFGFKRVSFASRVKFKVKEAIKFVTDFETAAIEMAAAQGFDFVVCGHIHMPQVKEVKTEKGSVTYLNSGDWVENLTSLEFENGEWTIYKYSEEAISDNDKEIQPIPVVGIPEILNTKLNQWNLPADFRI